MKAAALNIARKWGVGVCWLLWCSLAIVAMATPIMLLEAARPLFDASAILVSTADAAVIFYLVFGVPILTYYFGRALSPRSKRNPEDDPWAMLSEASRLAAEGDVADAIAEYEEIRRRFRGSGAAKDAEASIRNLKAKIG